jgi:hypothetical protein
VLLSLLPLNYLNPYILKVRSQEYEMVGIEILGASDHLALERLNPKVLLENLKPA